MENGGVAITEIPEPGSRDSSGFVGKIYQQRRASVGSVGRKVGYELGVGGEWEQENESGESEMFDVLGVEHGGRWGDGMLDVGYWMLVKIQNYSQKS
ncbi:MAG: hypothetical protein A3H98_13580 [Bacteroidetes bacterium RIFCSPLOWO2_02_FULL_36_8]|nr:MAG: hypothetical protein A3H98_13580 [Bacteroidetes bacterium RIFCSPLOWO2_02_FULL_36_8]OFY70654.1 MAG: hypothetical protein A3G23_07955 [Bacteroidetes bacterium RIFCSPLOWO2_12_FULL_37_12]